MSVGGCDQDGSNVDSPTQVAAIVNGDEITLHQVNNVLERNRNIHPENVHETRRQILDRLIDQQLAVQQAVQNRLDRSPKVMQAIEAAKNEILARAYLEQVAERSPQRFDWDAQNKEDVKRYYSAHPELFAQRRVFTIEELSFAASDDVATELREYMSQRRSIEDIAEWLKSRGTQFAAKQSRRAAEQISLKQLPDVQAMSQGQIALFELGNNQFQVIRVKAFREAPMDEETAAPRIQQFLSNQQSRAILAGEMKRIRDEAEIKYVGEFAGVAGEDDAVAQPK